MPRKQDSCSHYKPYILRLVWPSIVMSESFHSERGKAVKVAVKSTSDIGSRL